MVRAAEGRDSVPPSDGALVSASIATGLVALVVFALTAYRTLPGGDSGELIGAVASGGVIHPPGYPLYSLVGSAFLHLPGSVAFRLNLLSATCDAVAAGLLTFAVGRATSSMPAGVLSGALFAFCPGVWRYATTAEVFAMNNLFIAALLCLAVRFDRTRDDRVAIAGAFTTGLGLANHQTLLFTAVPIAVWALATPPRPLLRPGRLALLAAAGLLGLTPYLVLPVLASHHAYVSWGAADTWIGFWNHVLRREYGTLRLAPVGVGTDISPWTVLGSCLEHTAGQAGAWVLALSALGVGVCGRRAWRDRHGLAMVVLVAPVLCVWVMCALGNLPVEKPLYREIVARFWQQSDLYLALFAGVGFAAGAERIGRAIPRISGLAPALAASSLALVQLGAHYRAQDHHRDTLVQQYGSEILRVAPQGALLVTKGDLITNSVRYLALAEHMRPDVRVVDQELLATTWGRDLLARHAPGVVFPGPRLSLDPSAGFQLKQLLDANAEAPIMICGGAAPGDHSIDASYGLWPVGLCDDVHSGSAPVSMDAWLERSAEGTPRIDFDALPHPDGSWEGVVWGDYWETRQSRGAHILQIVGANASRFRYLGTAIDVLQKVVDENPAVAPHVHKNLAIAIGRAGITTDAQKAQAARAWEGYLRVAPPSDPQIPVIRAELERLRR
jgi:hypothetical protein